MDHVALPSGSDSSPSGGSLRARLDDGTEVLVRRRALGAEKPDALLQRLRRLAELRHPNLLPILGAEVTDGELRVFYEDDGGRTLAALLAGKTLKPGPAVAIGLSVLSGLKALQKAGQGHGALTADEVRVAAYGQVRLVGYGLQSGEADPRREVVEAGRLLCRILGIDPERQLDGNPSPMERMLPGLAAAALAIAAGNAGRSAGTAMMMFGDAAGHLAHRWRVYLSIADLEKLVAPRSPAIAAAVDAALATPRQPAPARWLSTLRRPTASWWPVPTVVAGGLLVILLGLAPAALIAHLPHPKAAATTPAAARPAPPQAVVTEFYSLASKHKTKQAAALWSSHLKAGLPPEQNIDQRYRATTVLKVNQARVTSQTGSTATVFVDLTEVKDGVQQHWVGTWRLVKSGGRWLLDAPDFRAA